MLAYSLMSRILCGFFKRFRRNSGCGLGQCSFGVECPLNRYRVLDSVPRVRERREGKKGKKQRERGRERQGDEDQKAASHLTPD